MRHAVWVGAVAVLVTGGAAAGQERKPDVIARLEGHIGGVSALAFNPRLSYLATGAGNGVVRVWEAKSGELVLRLPAQPAKSSGGRIQHLQFAAPLVPGQEITLLSTSSHNAVVVYNLTPPPVMKKEPVDPKNPEAKKEELPTPRKGLAQRPLISYEDGQGYDTAKIGTITGDGRRVYFSSTEGVRVGVASQVIHSDFGENTNDEFKGVFTPLAVDSIAHPDSSLVAFYGTVKAADRSEQPVVTFVGIGDARYVGRGTVRAAIPGRPASIKFAPDGKMLVACNGEDVMFWRVPTSQVVEGDPKILSGSPAYAAAPGPNGLVALASPPDDGKKVRVTVVDLSGAQARVVATYATTIDRVSALAFSPDGSILAVADDTEGAVQLWALDKK